MFIQSKKKGISEINDRRVMAGKGLCMLKSFVFILCVFFFSVCNSVYEGYAVGIEDIFTVSEGNVGTESIIANVRSIAETDKRIVSTVETAGKRIKLNKSSVTLFKGESVQLVLKNVPDKENIVWSVSAPKRVKVSEDGTITALKKGKATVTAEYNGVVYKCRVTVKPVPINGVFSDEEKYKYLFGTKVKFWTTDNKPSGFKTKSEAMSNMKTFSVPVWVINSKGEKISSTRSITVNSLLAKDVKKIFTEIYELEEKFPIDTLTGFRWNTNGEVSGPLLDNVTCMSAHAYGAAIDINYYQNDYYVGAGNDLRDTSSPYYITENVKAIFEKHGWYWGGDYAICSDTMHFQYTGLDMLSYNNGSPFVEYVVTKPTTYSVQVKNIQRRLNQLGFSCGAADGYYGENTDKAVMAFKEKYGIDGDTVTDESFYIALYNMTSEMYDVKK